MKLSAEEKLMYQVMKAIYESGIDAAGSTVPLALVTSFHINRRAVSN